MSEPEYTPGPWRWKWIPYDQEQDSSAYATERYWDGIGDEADEGIDQVFGAMFHTLEGEGGETVLFGFSRSDGTGDVVVPLENARLIAAAPELFQALKDLYSVSKKMEGASREAWQKANARAQEAMRKAVAS